jgi:hypothetical protein
MEGDAGARRLNPPPMSMLSRLRRRRPKIEESDVTDESNTEVEADPIEPTAQDATDPVAEPAPEAEAAPEAELPEQPAAEAETEAPPPADEAEQAEADGEDTEDSADVEADVDAEAEDSQRPASALGRAWLAGIAATLVLLAGALGAGGYVALRYHHQSQAIARNNAAALKAAIDCVSATQAPDTNAMIASEQKIIECGTDAFRQQAMLYTSMLVQAYQSANVHVQVSDVRGAVERDNKDGSIDVLVAMRVKVDAQDSQNETGYRLRVRMAMDEGQYRIARLDQVTK